MFESKASVFWYAISPVHMGAGTALGAIDNPIQRERHTRHPVLAGTGLKGALRHAASNGGSMAEDVEAVFGPDPEKTGNASDHAGALSMADGQLVLFPVRSLRQSYVYATCPTAMARLKRLLLLSGIEEADWKLPEPKTGEAVVLNKEGLCNKDKTKLVLEAYDFTMASDSAQLDRAAAWLAANAIADGSASKYFCEKIKTDTVMLSDDRFNYFARNATVVEPHVRIDDDTGTADDGGLFYTECVPPESLFVSLAMASRQRGKGVNGMKADQVLDRIVQTFDNQMVQVGGDATTGRGQMLVSIAGPGVKKEARHG